MNITESSSFTEDFLEPGTTRLSASAVAKLFDMRPQDLAEFAGVQIVTPLPLPESEKLQGVLRELMRLVSLATRVEPDLQRSVGLIKGASISALGGKTLMQLAGAGRMDDAVGYLESIRSGYLG
ncbi:DNA-binding protein [Achromobacter sp. PD1]|jgi:hypothetical protein|uniref:DNA-binding protein n=1 Tax=Achromobacter sp. PD1 TaxID=3399125 RepID=UPI003AF98E0F